MRPKEDEIEKLSLKGIKDDYWGEDEYDHKLFNQEHLYDRESDDKGFLTLSDDDENLEVLEKCEWPMYDHETPFGSVQIDLGQLFDKVEVLRKALIYYNSQTHKAWNYCHNEPKRILVKCKSYPKCKWKLSARYTNEYGCLHVWFFKDIHTFAPTKRNRRANANFFAEEYQEKLLKHLTWKLKLFIRDVKEIYGVKISRWQASSAKKNALSSCAKVVEKQYESLRDYMYELRRSNHDTSVFLALKPHVSRPIPQFHMFYVSFLAIRKVMDNFKNVPQYLYGLSPSQMDMFMTEDNPVRRQSEKVTEQSISSASNYLDNGGMWSCRGTDNRGPSKYSMSVSMYRGGGRGFGRPRTAPPDLPSLLLDARIIYLGMPIVPAVTELLVAQFMWLDYDNPAKPIYLYINSSGTQNEKMETVGSETEAYAIADTMAYCKSDVYTVNCGMAYGQAAMLLSLGTKGFRALQPNSSSMTLLPIYLIFSIFAPAKLYLPKVNRSSGAVIDMWIKAKELEANTDYYIELLAKGIGKSKEELAKDIQRPKYFQALEAIEYGNYDDMLAQSKAMRRGGPGQALAAPSGFR
ncbi:hypothetical protein KSS87_016288 [Heliosperma pusillum]|nr:hypothetical protein KSS87_016288 [Heliosperma pusillum]